MAWIRKTVLLSAIALLTSHCCFYRLEELRHTVPTGSPYQTELAKLYMDFATQEEKEYDWFSSAYFAGKGLKLAYGKEVGPEALQDWDIPKQVLPEMEKARAELLRVVTPDVMRASPSKAAAAQFFFDCWAEQQEENWQEDDIAYCRDNLTKTLIELRGVKPSAAEGKAPAKKAKKASKPAAAETPEASSTPVTESTSYAVFFESGKAEVTDPGRNVIDEIIRSLRNVSSYEVILHTGSNVSSLAAQRVQVVKKLLASGGVNENAIAINGKAASEAKPDTHRVEIYLNE